MWRLLWKALAGCDWDEGRLALRLYWQSHRRFLIRLLLVVPGISIILVMVSFACCLPTIPVGLSYQFEDMDSYILEQSRLFPHLFLPFLTVLVLFVTPRVIHYPTGLSENAIRASHRSWAVSLACVSQLAYYFSWIANNNDQGIDLFLPLSNYCQYISVGIVIWIISSVVTVNLLYSMNDWIKPRRSYLLITVIWLFCHLLLNTIRWEMRNGIEVGSPYGTDPTFIIGQWGYLLLVIQAVLLSIKRYRVATFITSCLVFTLVHLTAIFILNHTVSGIYLLLSYSGLLSIGLPPSAWSLYLATYK